MPGGGRSPSHGGNGMSPRSAARLMEPVAWPANTGVDVRDFGAPFGRPVRKPRERTFADELRAATVDESPYQRHVAPVAPPRRKPTAAEVAERRVLRVMDDLEKAMGSSNADAADALKAELARRARATAGKRP